MNTLACAVLLLAVSARAENPGAKAAFDEAAASVPDAAAAKALKAIDAQAPADVNLSEGGPTVVCDGAGGYRVDMKGKQILLFGSCLKAHEEYHAQDLKSTCPDGCKGQKSGETHPLDNSGGRCPAFAAEDSFWKWRIRSECAAYNAELKCLRALYKAADPEKKGQIRARIKKVRSSIRFWDGKGSEVKPPSPCEEQAD